MGSRKKPKRWSKSQQDEQMCQDLDPRHRHVKSDNREPAASSSTIGRDVEGALSLRSRTTFQDNKGDKNTSNMLATSNFGSTSSQPHKFLPSVPSPLSPRRANVQASSSSFWSFDTSMTNSTPQQASNQQSHVPFSSRPVKTAPIPRSDALRERRRDMFLRKVRQSRDDNKWDSRIDDVRITFLHRPMLVLTLHRWRDSITSKKSDDGKLNKYDPRHHYTPIYQTPKKTRQSTTYPHTTTRWPGIHDRSQTTR